MRMFGLLDRIAPGEAATYAARAQPARLAYAPPFLRQLRHPDRDLPRRLGSEMPQLPRRAFPARRPGGDHDRRAPTAALLGRQPLEPAGRYSALAGFLEPGESIEEAVAREIKEEAGVTVTDVR